MNSGSCGQMTTLCAINLTLALLESNFGHVISNVNERISSQDENLFLCVSVFWNTNLHSSILYFVTHRILTLSGTSTSMDVQSRYQTNVQWLVNKLWSFFLMQNRYHDTSIPIKNLHIRTQKGSSNAHCFLSC